ncbi:MAG: hypothetical protein CME60_11810 [Halobacteriovoraceae bacterium]|nr:hypothetical protein [Halobacteriovoraceae bacterium]|tara:strand:- start:41550 stop:41771 length:222 start_codon:yes stop_codon:yes gene_type:complete
MNYSINADDSALFFDNRIWDEWLSTCEAAKFLSTTPNAIRIMVCRGKLKASKLGRRLRFKISDLRNLLSSKGD